MNSNARQATAWDSVRGGIAVVLQVKCKQAANFPRITAEFARTAFESGKVCQEHTIGETRILSLLSALTVASASWPLWCFWRAVRRTALRSTSLWASGVCACWFIVTLLGTLDAHSGESARLGLLRLVAAAFTLSPLVAVLGARRPGEVAWNLIVLSLMIVFLLPVLEQSLLGKPLERGRIGWDGPRSLFFVIVGIVGFVNYLPTRFALAALLFASALALQLAAIGPWPGVATRSAGLMSLAGIMLAACAWTAWLLRPRRTPQGIDAAWRNLRDGWGLVWGLRVRDRWNAAAAQYGWPLRLEWRGLIKQPCARDLSEREWQRAEGELRLLLRRFGETDSA